MVNSVSFNSKASFGCSGCKAGKVAVDYLTSNGVPKNKAMNYLDATAPSYGKISGIQLEIDGHSVVNKSHSDLMREVANIIKNYGKELAENLKK